MRPKEEVALDGVVRATVSVQRSTRHVACHVANDSQPRAIFIHIYSNEEEGTFSSLLTDGALRA